MKIFQHLIFSYLILFFKEKQYQLNTTMQLLS